MKHTKRRMSLINRLHFIGKEVRDGLSRHFFAPGILIFLTVLIYYPTLYYPFQFDDIANISKKFGIRIDDPLKRWMASSRWFGDWLNRLNFEIGRFDPFYYRLFNLLIHILAGLCVFYLIYTLCKFLKSDLFITTQAYLIGFLTSGLFLLHPVQTQTVLYIIQARLEGLASLFVLATISAYVLLVTAKKNSIKIMAGLLTGIFGLLACGTKEIVIVLPFLLLLIDWFFLSDQKWSSIKMRVLSLFVITVIFSYVMVHYIGINTVMNIFTGNMITGNNRGNILTMGPYDIIKPWHFFISQFKVVLHYLFIFLWPFNISVEYDWKLANSFFSFDVVVPGLILISLFIYIASLVFMKKRPIVVAGLLWFFIAVAPRSTFIPSPELMSDYKTYLASVGIYLIFAVTIIFLLEKIWKKFVNHPITGLWHDQRMITMVLGLLIIGFGSYNRAMVWESNVAFWEDNARKAPGKARVYNNLGVALSEAGRTDESIVAYQKAISLDPYYADPLSNIAVAYSAKNDIDKAIDSLKAAITICPNYPEAYNNLGSLFLSKKDFDEARRYLECAVHLRPYYGKAYYNLARLYEERGDFKESWSYLKKATQGDLDIPEVFFKLGQMSLRIEKYQEAINAFDNVIGLGMRSDLVVFNLANAYFLLTKYDKACSLFKELMKNNPQDSRYAYNLAETYFTLKKYDKAFAVFNQVIESPQPVANAFFRAANCLENMNKSKEAQEYLTSLLVLNVADDFKKVVKEEVMRIALKEKVHAGNGSITLQDFKKVLALNNTGTQKN